MADSERKTNYRGTVNRGTVNERDFHLYKLGSFWRFQVDGIGDIAIDTDKVDCIQMASKQLGVKLSYDMLREFHDDDPVFLSNSGMGGSFSVILTGPTKEVNGIGLSEVRSITPGFEMIFWAETAGIRPALATFYFW